MRNPNPFSRFATLALAAVLSAAPLHAGVDCLAISVDGALAATIFVDGFESGDDSAWGLPALPSFSMVATEDLAVAVELDSGVTGDHVLELRYFLPGGALYQSVAQPFTAGGEGPTAGPARAVAGYPFPIAPVLARRLDLEAPAGSGWIVPGALPVAGTSIAEAGLAGAWRIEAYLDGEESACGAPAGFRLENR